MPHKTYTKYYPCAQRAKCQLRDGRNPCRIRQARAGKHQSGTSLRAQCCNTSVLLQRRGDTVENRGARRETFSFRFH